jgi:hypothetical protein
LYPQNELKKRAIALFLREWDKTVDVIWIPLLADNANAL